MNNSLLHFEKGVPIDDLALRPDQKRRLARVSHVYWQWIRNPFTIDYKALFRQMVKGHFADPPSETRAAQKDIQLFEYIKDTVSPMSRREAQTMVEWAAKKTIQIGAETDNVMALTKGGKLLYDVAGLDKPEEDRQDMSKIVFLPSVVVTNVKDLGGANDNYENYDDEEVKRIAEKYGAYIDPKRQMVDDQVAAMEARSGKTPLESDNGNEEEEKEDDDEQDRN